MHCPICKTPLREDLKDSFEVAIHGGERRASLLDHLPPDMSEPIPSWMTTWWLCFTCMNEKDAPWASFRDCGTSSPLTQFTYTPKCVFCNGDFRPDRADTLEVALRGPKTKAFEDPYYSKLPQYMQDPISRAIKVPAWESFSSMCLPCLEKIPSKWKSLFRPMQADEFMDLGPLPYKM
jgi:hypothetical protein